MKNIKLLAIAFLVIVLAVAATYSIKTYSSASKIETANHSNNIADVFTCPMHPEVTQNEPGACPKCGMDLVLKNEKKDNSNGQSMECCKDSAKCKEMGCNMELCKTDMKACMDKCMKSNGENKDGMKHDMKMMNGCNGMKQGCNKSGSCCGQ